MVIDNNDTIALYVDEETMAGLLAGQLVRKSDSCRARQFYIVLGRYMMQCLKFCDNF